jgi:hypothetical protein
MRLKAFIKNECCNFVSQACIGADYNMHRFNDTNACVILEDEPKACKFFRECVLPIAHHRGVHNEVVDQYSFVDKKLKKEKNRYCDCGKKLEKSERSCAKCTKLSKKKKRKK